MIGVSSFAFQDQPLSHALEEIEEIADCAEIFSEGLHDLSRYGQAPFSYDLKYTVHAPSTDVNLSSIREPVRQAGLTVIRQMADICNTLDADIMVVHPGYVSFSHDLAAASAAFNSSVSELASISRETGVKICIENMPKWDCFLLRYPDLDIDENGFTLDVGHANTLDNLNEFTGRDISHFHLHDNNGDMDEHLHIGGGNIDFIGLSDLLKKSPAIKIIENKCKQDVEKSLAALNKMGIK